jgi:hypothetical protein
VELPWDLGVDASVLGFDDPASLELVEDSVPLEDSELDTEVVVPAALSEPVPAVEVECEERLSVL